MFEVGKCYRVKMWKDGGITEYVAERVIEVSLPLVKFKGSALIGGGEIIVNTVSLAFVSAQEVE
jgi:hypothetical protein